MIDVRQRRKNIITLTGTPCSGKSTLNTLLTSELRFASHSLGDIVKAAAEDKGVDPETFYEMNLITVEGEETALDDYLDSLQTRWGTEEDNFVLDSRLGFYFVPQSFRVFVFCSPDIAAKRGHASRKKQHKYSSPPEAEKTILARLEFERRNYQAKYGIPNYQDPYHFDFVLDNSSRIAEEGVAQILDQFAAYQERTKEMEIIARSFATIMAPKVSYVSSPISEGKLMYAYLREKNLPFDESLKHHSEFLERVIKPNKRAAEELGEEITSKGGTIIVPAIFYRPGWSERDYLDLWIPLIDAKINEVSFVQGWEYSGGCVEEYLFAQQRGIPCFDARGEMLPISKARELLNYAMADLSAQDIGHNKLKELYAKME